MVVIGPTTNPNSQTPNPGLSVSAQKPGFLQMETTTTNI